MVRLQFDLTVALSRSSLDARRGVVRVHPYVLDVLRMRPWDALEVRGLRTTAALAGATRVDAEESRIYLDELTCANAGVAPGNIVSVGRADVVPAVAVDLSGVPSEDLEPELLRLVLLGKVVGAGDRVALIPQGFARPRDAPDELHLVVSSFQQSLGRRLAKP
jgi:transitional endoplasmic reticulum ATPase